jgi:hypothetical protein
MTEGLSQQEFQTWLRVANVGGTMVYAQGSMAVAKAAEGTEARKL